MATAAVKAVEHCIRNKLRFAFHQDIVSSLLGCICVIKTGRITSVMMGAGGEASTRLRRPV